MKQHIQKHTAAEQQIRILIVIPTYNNQSTLRDIVMRSMQTGLDVLVVNDGSKDGGPDQINDLDIHHIDLPENKGKGIAITEAAKWAEENNYTHVITVDADGQHHPEEAVKFVEKIKDNPLSIILGNRNFDETDTPASSDFGRKFSNFWVKVSAGVSVKDSQSGYRAYPVEALTKIKCLSRRYNFEVEILVKGVWAGLAVQSVDTTVVYDKDTIEASHFRPFVDNARISLTYTYLVTRNLFPWPHKVLFGKKPSDNFRYFFLHPFKSIKSLAMEKSTPKEIVQAVMVGIFLATLPLFAMHSVTIVFVATRLKLNRLIALNVSHVCAPPFVPAMGVELGYFLLNGHFLTEFSMQTLGHEALQRLGNYLLGSIILAPFLALLAGLIAYIVIHFFRKAQKQFGRKKEVNSVA
jgi:glycosyltransferase involved in cell wall biosynthesis